MNIIEFRMQEGYKPNIEHFPVDNLNDALTMFKSIIESINKPHVKFLLIKHNKINEEYALALKIDNIERIELKIEKREARLERLLKVNREDYDQLELVYD